MSKFIVLEGPEGVGKTTQAKMLARWLQEQTGEPVTLCRDPGTTTLGEMIRGRLASESPLPRDTCLYLFMAARAQLVEEVIKPANERGEWVVCDRYATSTAVYQGRLQNDIGRVRYLNSFGDAPDLLVFLDADFNEAIARLEKRQRVAKPINYDIQHRSHVAYQKEADREHPDRAVVVNADPTPEEVAASIQAAVASHFEMDVS